MRLINEFYMNINKYYIKFVKFQFLCQENQGLNQPIYS